MEVVFQLSDVERYMQTAVRVSGDNPVLIDRFIENAIEVDVDVLCDAENVFIAGVMEHIEEAGIHSGDSACSLPPQTLPPYVLKKIHQQTRELAFSLNVIGLMNVQFAIKNDEVFLLSLIHIS